MKVKKTVLKLTENVSTEHIKREDMEKALKEIDIEDYDAIGLRRDDRKYEVGDEIPASKDWDDGQPTNNDLPGTSTFGLQTYDDGWIGGSKISLMTYRHYPHIYIVGGDIAEYGEDSGELVLSNCKVLARVEVI